MDDARLVSYARRRARPHPGCEAADLAQEARLAAFLPGRRLDGAVTNALRTYGPRTRPEHGSRLRAERLGRPLHEPLRDGGPPLSELVPADVEPADAAVVEAEADARRRRAAARALRRLPPREAEAVRLHFLDGLTMAAAGRRMGVTGGRVSQLVKSALVRLRSHALRSAPTLQPSATTGADR